jgi:hypothetical protein
LIAEDLQPEINGIRLDRKGNYAEVTVQKNGEIWKLLLNQKNLVLLTLQAKKIIEEMRNLE